MFNYLTELMFNHYFGLNALFGGYLKDGKRLFDALCKIYLVDEKTQNDLYALTGDERVADIVTEKDYFRYKRIKQYAAMSNLDISFDSLTEETIDVKGSAILAAKKANLIQASSTSCMAVCKLLRGMAEGGNILAMNFLGVLLQEGIIFAKDGKAGLAYLKKASEWNSEEGLLAMLRYDTQNKDMYLGRLFAKLGAASHIEALSAVKAAYGSPSGEAPAEYRLLQKAFETGILKEDTYAKPYARVIYANLFGYKDKESLIFAAGKDSLAEAANLPLKMSRDNLAPCNKSALLEDAVMGNSQKEFIEGALDNSDLCCLSAYRPLCIVSDSSYLTEVYARKLEQCFSGARIERIEVADLIEYDLEPTKNNVFVRNCYEDRPNVYMLFFRGLLPERVADIAKTFLQTAKRAKFRLNRPGVSLDLAPVLPICFCDRDNAKGLEQYCEVLTLPEFGAAEKARIAAEMLAAKGKFYSVKYGAIPDSFCQKLASLSLDDMERIADRMMRDARKTPGIAFTEEMLAKYLKSNTRTHTAFGFGGGDHEGD